MRNQAFFFSALALAMVLGLGGSPASAGIFDRRPTSGSLTDGFWATRMTRDGTEYILAMRFLAKGRFALATFKDNQVISKQGGTYRVGNGRLEIKLGNGQTWTYQYRLDGDRLTLVSSTNKVVFQRVRGQSASKAVTPRQLQGTWVLTGNGGRIVTRITGNRIELTVTNAKGEVVVHVTGTCTISGDKLMVRTDNGKQGAVPFRLKGDRLTLVIDSETFTMTRAKAEAKPERKGLGVFPSIS